MFNLSIKVPSTTSFDQLLRTLDVELDTERLEDEASAILLNRIRTNFLAERDPEGNPWKPSKAGIARRAKGGTGTLYKTGTLFRSIQLSAVGGNRSIGTDVPYAEKHQLGIGVEKRVFLGVTQSDAELYEKFLIKRIRKALK